MPRRHKPLWWKVDRYLFIGLICGFILGAILGCMMRGFSSAIPWYAVGLTVILASIAGMIIGKLFSKAVSHTPIPQYVPKRSTGALALLKKRRGYLPTFQPIPVIIVTPATPKGECDARPPLVLNAT